MKKSLLVLVVFGMLNFGIRNLAEAEKIDLKSNIGKQVTLKGNAVNGKLGAALLVEGYPVYIDGLDRWPKGFYHGGGDGKKIEVTGTVMLSKTHWRSTPELAIATIECGQWYSLKSAEWKVLEDFDLSVIQELVDNLSIDVDYDQSAMAYDELKRYGPMAFSVLMENLDNAKESHPQFSGDYMGDSFPIGFICFMILQEQVEYIYSKNQPEFLSEDNVGVWWAKNKGRPLRDLQSDALKWKLNEIQTSDEWKESRDWHLEQLRAKCQEFGIEFPESDQITQKNSFGQRFERGVSPAKKNNGLTAILQVPTESVCKDALIVDFVLTNTLSDKDIKIFERWNSWGAHNWKFEVQDKKGNSITFNNPQTEWTRNFPSTQVIKAGESFVLKSHLWFDNNKLDDAWAYDYDPRIKLNTFMQVSKKRLEGLEEITKIRGIYSNFYEATAVSDPFEEEAWQGVWEGTVETEWQNVTVKDCKSIETLTPLYISKDKALKTAQKVCQEKGWEWDDVSIEAAQLDLNDMYLIRTKSSQR